MKVITTPVYTFDELSDEAKEKARAWYRESMQDDYQFAAEHITEDAERIGLKITSWDTDSCSNVRDMEGEFIDGVFNCANKIMAEHGESCETYKDAARFLKAWSAIPDDDKSMRRIGEQIDACDAIESEFLHALLEDYRLILQKEFEYRESDECIDETIIANEYTFTVDGKRFG